ncbi:hypothetical protein SAMN05518801_101365 [Novosphingobium sp. CF614]|nr:hypothetical protein SAMN05518801_101365 [Novosphingobium sp. CF614]
MSSESSARPFRFQLALDLPKGGFAQMRGVRARELRR